MKHVFILPCHGQSCCTAVFTFLFLPSHAHLSIHFDSRYLYAHKNCEVFQKKRQFFWTRSKISMCSLLCREWKKRELTQRKCKLMKIYQVIGTILNVQNLLAWEPRSICENFTIIECDRLLWINLQYQLQLLITSLVFVFLCNNCF